MLHMQMASERSEYLRKLKRHAFVNGVGLVGLSIHQGFVRPKAADRQKNIDHTIHCMELAHELGIPCIRLNTGRWRTSKSFDELMANRGIEPAIPGYTDEDGFKWCIDRLKNACRPPRNLGCTWRWKITGAWRALRKDCCGSPRPLTTILGLGC